MAQQPSEKQKGGRKGKWLGRANTNRADRPVHAVGLVSPGSLDGEGAAAPAAISASSSLERLSIERRVAVQRPPDALPRGPLHPAARQRGQRYSQDATGRVASVCISVRQSLLEIMLSSPSSFLPPCGTESLRTCSWDDLAQRSPLHLRPAIAVVG
jgi:hypothetical protein